MTNQDVAAAEIIFEGELESYETEQFFVTHSKRPYLRGSSPELVFKVNKVLRGEIKDETIRVGWVHGTFGYPAWQEEFEKRYGKNLRVALTTPEQVERFCYVDRYYEIQGQRKARYDCDIHLSGFYPEGRAAEIPFIVNGPCSGPYMFNVETAPNDLYFPKSYSNRLSILSDSAELALRFAQKYPEKITKEFLEDPDNKAPIIQLTLKIVDEIEQHSRKTSQRFHESKDADIAEFNGRLEDYFVRRLKNYIPLFEKDPAFKARVMSYRNSLE